MVKWVTVTNNHKFPNSTITKKQITPEDNEHLVYQLYAPAKTMPWTGCYKTVTVYLHDWCKIIVSHLSQDSKPCQNIKNMRTIMLVLSFTSPPQDSGFHKIPLTFHITDEENTVYYLFKTSVSLKYSANLSFTTSILCIKIMPIFLEGSLDLFLVPHWLVSSQYLAFPFYHIPQVHWLYKTQK
jgi:hypothetical protein